MPLATLQRTFDLRQASGERLCFVRPMVSMDTVKAVLDLSEDEVLAEIEQGRLLWAWNLSAETGRMFLRFWARTVHCYLNANLAQPLQLEGVLESLLPEASRITGTLKGTTLQRIFNVTSTHVMALIEAGLLEPRTGWKTGPNGSPEVSRASVERLLRQRWLGNL